MAWIDKSRVTFRNGNLHPLSPKSEPKPDHGLFRAEARNTQMFATITEQAFEFKGRIPMKEFISSHDRGEKRRVQVPWDPVEHEKGLRIDDNPPRGDLYNPMNKVQPKESKGAPQWGIGKKEYADKNKGTPFSPTIVQQRPEYTLGGNERFPISYFGRKSNTPKTEWHDGTGKPSYAAAAPPEKDEKTKPFAYPPVTKKSIDGGEQGYAREKSMVPPAFKGAPGIHRNVPYSAQPKRDENNRINPYHDSSSSSSPKKKSQALQRKTPAFQNVFGSEEARRMYSSKAANTPLKVYDGDDDDDDENSEIINSVEAARRYNGVLV